MLYVIVAAIAVGIVALDQISKALIVAFLAEGGSVTWIPGILRLTYVRNGNGMMGLFGEFRWFFLVISILIVAVIVVFLWKVRPKNRLMCTALAMLIGGGIGNMIDRAFQPDGKVVDFIDFCAFPKLWHYIFNVADIFVCVGVGLMILYLLLDTVQEGKKAKEKRLVTAEATITTEVPAEDAPDAEEEASGCGDGLPQEDSEREGDGHESDS